MRVILSRTTRSFRIALLFAVLAAGCALHAYAWNFDDLSQSSCNNNANYIRCQGIDGAFHDDSHEYKFHKEYKSKVAKVSGTTNQYDITYAYSYMNKASTDLNFSTVLSTHFGKGVNILSQNFSPVGSTPALPSTSTVMVPSYPADNSTVACNTYNGYASPQFSDGMQCARYPWSYSATGNKDNPYTFSGAVAPRAMTATNGVINYSGGDTSGFVSTIDPNERAGKYFKNTDMKIGQSQTFEYVYTARVEVTDQATLASVACRKTTNSYDINNTGFAVQFHSAHAPDAPGEIQYFTDNYSTCVDQSMLPVVNVVDGGPIEASKDMFSQTMDMGTLDKQTWRVDPFKYLDNGWENSYGAQLVNNAQRGTITKLEGENRFKVTYRTTLTNTTSGTLPTQGIFIYRGDYGFSKNAALENLTATPLNDFSKKYPGTVVHKIVNGVDYYLFDLMYDPTPFDNVGNSVPVSQWSVPVPAGQSLDYELSYIVKLSDSVTAQQLACSSNVADGMRLRYQWNAGASDAHVENGTLMDGSFMGGMCGNLAMAITNAQNVVGATNPANAQLSPGQYGTPSAQVEFTPTPEAVNPPSVPTAPPVPDVSLPVSDPIAGSATLPNEVQLGDHIGSPADPAPLTNVDSGEPPTVGITPQAPYEGELRTLYNETQVSEVGESTNTHTVSSDEGVTRTESSSYDTQQSDVRDRSRANANDDKITDLRDLSHQTVASRESSFDKTQYALAALLILGAGISLSCGALSARRRRIPTKFTPVSLAAYAGKPVMNSSSSAHLYDHDIEFMDIKVHEHERVSVAGGSIRSSARTPQFDETREVRQSFTSRIWHELMTRATRHKAYAKK